MITTNKRRSKGLDFQEGGVVYLNRKNIKTLRLSEKLDYTKLRLFKILEKKGLVIFKLDILEYIKIYSIFYKSLLELYYNKDAILYEPVLEENYHIDNRIPEEIIERRLFQNKIHYLVYQLDIIYIEDMQEVEEILTQKLLNRYYY